MVVVTFVGTIQSGRFFFAAVEPREFTDRSCGRDFWVSTSILDELRSMLVAPETHGLASCMRQVQTHITDLCKFFKHDPLNLELERDRHECISFLDGLIRSARILGR